MLKDITKKLSMKKTFFTTQLESFFDAISQEYQNLLHEKEVENSLLKEQNRKYARDIENLVKIKHDLQTKLQMQREEIARLKKELETKEQSRISAPKSDSEEVAALKEKIKKLQEYISRGASAYGEHLMNQKSEEIVKEISEKIKK
ncbi:MAG: hypothetical protein B6D59_08275 [Campylobacteraceae bacterium 4484_4]|nr:MAG: hypothetical protein B6D59_08275 [Campylobacteraceae bacterium 4484_4]